MKAKSCLLILLLFCSCRNGSRVQLKEAEISAATAKDTLYYFGSRQYNLTGALTLEKFWGPPNFGEDTLTDRRDTFLVFHLSKPIQVYYEDSVPKSDRFCDTVVTASNMQLFGWYRPELIPYLGHPVTLQGKLGEPVNGQMHTPVMFDFKEVIK